LNVLLCLKSIDLVNEFEDSLRVRNVPAPCDHSPCRDFRIQFFLHKQIRILRLQALDGGQRFQRKIIKRLLRGLVDDDVALMRIVVFLGIPGLAVAGVDISGLGITCSL
jgi:hypothetical protein